VSKASPFKHAEADASAGFLLWKMTALWQQRLALVLESLGITQTQYAILASLKWFEENKEPTTQTHLGEHAHIEKMTLSKAIRQLEKKDFFPARNQNRTAEPCSFSFRNEGRR